MSIAEDLLARGYFPGELPPPFVTTTLGAALPALRAAWQGDYRGTWSRPARHNLARAGMLRRALTIPNPVHHVSLCEVVEQSISELGVRWGSPALSLSVPVSDTTRAFKRCLTEAQLRDRRAIARASARYTIRTDIERFYGSIYTHSLDWALSGKDVAKANPTDGSRVGVKIDKMVRIAQDGQTVGIPIGPDTSLLLAEMLLCKVDEGIWGALRGNMLRGFRSMDDYELTFRSLREAEAALAIIQESLREFELALNSRKTEIIELPVPLEARWATVLKGIEIRSGGKGQQRDILRLFDTALEMVPRYRDQALLKYVVAFVDDSSLVIERDYWHLVETYLLSCLRTEPGTASRILPLLKAYEKAGYNLDITALDEVLQDIIIEHGRFDHGSEVAWALWGLIEFNLGVQPTAVKTLTQAEDPFVALLALDARARGWIPSTEPFARWGAWMTPKMLWEPQWPVAYEALVKAWLPSATGSDYLQSEPWFRDLRASGVSFYDTSRRLRPARAIPGATNGRNAAGSYG